MINILFPHKRYSFINESILENLPEDISQLIKENLTTLKLKKGQVLFHEGTAPIGLYIIKSGKIKKYTTGIEGKEHIFYLAKENEMLGHRSLLSKEPHCCSSACLSDCIINLIPKEIFYLVLNLDQNLLNRFLKSLAHEFGVFINNSKILAQHSVRERCAISIIKLKEFFNVSDGGFKISRKDHSNIVGTSVESLIRVLHDFKEEEIIKINENSIFVLNPKKLVQISNMV